VPASPTQVQTRNWAGLVGARRADVDDNYGGDVMERRASRRSLRAGDLPEVFWNQASLARSCRLARSNDIVALLENLAWQNRSAISCCCAGLPAFIEMSTATLPTY